MSMYMLFEKPGKHLDIGLKSISKIAIFLFIIAGNYAGDIYSCSLRKLFSKYMFLKHILGFFIMLLFIGLIQEELRFEQKLSESAFLYIWFIIIMRAPMFISLITIILITIMYVLFSYSEDLKKDQRNEKYNNILLINRFIFIASILISFIGTLVYSIYLKKKLKNKFNYVDYFLGFTDQACFSNTKYMPEKIKKRL